MKKRKKAKNKLFLIVAILFALLFLFSGVMLVRELRETKQEAETFAALAALRLPQPSSASLPKVVPSSEPSPTPQQVMIGGSAAADTPSPEKGSAGQQAAPTAAGPKEPTPLPRYLPLYELNPEYFAWITVPDTVVDYPVMYSPQRPLQYLGHDFYGNFSYAGVPFLDADCDPNGNFYLVYGHQMRNGAMFGGLMAYKEKAFWEDHKTFHFDTLYEERVYAVVLAMRARVLNKNEKNGFRYYNYTSLDTEGEFEEYMQQARRLALYDTGVDTAYGDELLVLSTCDHYTENGRFVIIAKRVTD